MSSANTTGTLKVFNVYADPEIRTPDGTFIANLGSTDKARADARRLVACWNACEGSSTDWLEFQYNAAALAQFGPFKPFESRYRSELLKAVKTLEQRDALLTALREAVAWIEGSTNPPNTLLDRLESVIAKAVQP